MNIKLIKFIDKYIGFVLCFLLGIVNILFIKKKYSANKILILQFWGVGETILTLPAINALKKRYPKSNISLLCTKRNQDVYFENEAVEKLIVNELNPAAIMMFILKNFKKYDLVIDFEEYLNISALIAFFTGRYSTGFSGQIRSNLYNKKVRYNDNQHVVLTHLDLIRLVDVKDVPNSLIRLNYSKKDKMNCDKLLIEHNITQKHYLIGFGAGLAESAKSRRWPKDKYAKLAAALYKNNSKFLFFGMEEEKALIEEIIMLINNKTVIDNCINLAGKSTLREAFYLIEKCRLFISNDTGTLHIAAAQGVKTVGLYGPNLPLRWGPVGEGNISIYKGKICKYSPCINVHKGQVPECRFGQDNKCMKAIKVDEVLKLIKF
ncbi:MAG: glycosyltransferase family 9 protein [Nanoarchaeota archaeon]